jgi:aminopeptidase YwaD
MNTVRRLAVSLAFLFVSVRGAAQPAGAPAAAALSPAAARVQGDVAFLASDDLKGRRAGTPEADRAAAWIVDQFKRIGLSPAGPNGAWLQPFDFIDGVDLGPKNRLETGTAGTQKTWAVGTDFRPLAFSAAGAAEGEVIFAGYGIVAKDLGYDDYQGLDVKDKVVLVLRYSPDGDDEKSPFSPFAALRFKAAAAHEKGARAILVAAGPLTKDVPDDLIALRTDAAFSDAGIVAMSVRRHVAETLLAGSGKTLEAAQRAIDEAKKPASLAVSGSHIALNVDVTPHRARTSNVIGLLKGSDAAKSAEIVVVGAHYDHLGLGGSTSLAAGSGPQIHHGADDNASGVAAMLETARDLAAKRATLPRSVLFIAFAAEELGTLGSLHFTKNPTVPWDSVVAMLNMDMVGRLRGDKLDVQGVGTSPAWKGLVESSNAEAKLKLALLEGGFGPSDHSPFYAAKKPVLFAFTGAHADYHKPSDTADRIDAEGIVRVVKFVEPVVAAVAAAPERIPFSEVKGGTAPSGSRSFRVWVGGIPDFSEEGQGVKLSGVTGGSPAEKAGLMAGDTIVRFGDKELRNLYDYTYALQGKKPGEKVNIVVKRVEDGKTVEKTLEVTLGSRPDATK